MPCTLKNQAGKTYGAKTNTDTPPQQDIENQISNLYKSQGFFDCSYRQKATKCRLLQLNYHGIITTLSIAYTLIYYQDSCTIRDQDNEKSCHISLLFLLQVLWSNLSTIDSRPKLPSKT